jgi:hypothetical protein
MTPTPPAPWPKPTLLWQHGQLFREPDYPDGQLYMDPEEDDAESSQ